MLCLSNSSNEKRDDSLFLAGLLGDLGNLLVHLSLELVAGLPVREPVGELLQVGLDGVEHGVGLEEAQDGHEDVVAYRVLGGDEVEDGAQGVEAQTDAVDGAGGDGLGEGLAEGREVLLGVLGLEDEVDHEVGRGGELLLGHRRQGRRRTHQLGQDLLLLGLVLDEGLHLVGDVKVVGHLAGELLEGAVDEEQLRLRLLLRSRRHDCWFFAVSDEGCRAFGLRGGWDAVDCGGVGKFGWEEE